MHLIHNSVSAFFPKSPGVPSPIPCFPPLFQVMADCRWNNAIGPRSFKAEVSRLWVAVATVNVLANLHRHRLLRSKRRRCRCHSENLETENDVGEESTMELALYNIVKIIIDKDEAGNLPALGLFLTPRIIHSPDSEREKVLQDWIRRLGSRGALRNALARVGSSEMETRPRRCAHPTVTG